MQTTTVTLGSLIDSALYEIEHPSERGIALVMSSSNYLENATDAQFALQSGALKVNDLAEFGSELVLVTEKSADVTPIYTVHRGYYGTTAVAHGAAATGQANPQFPRRRAADFVNKALTRMSALGVPLISSGTFNRESGKRQIVLPEDVHQVLQVLYVNPTTGRVLPLDGWQEYDNLPTTLASSGKVLSIPWYVMDADDIHVVYSEPYTWTGTFPEEDATVTLPAAAVDLPATYAAAMLVAGREVSRAQLDRVEEWAQTEPLRGQGGGALVRAKWQEFYRLLDEARRVVALEVPLHRPMIKRPKVGV